jgi:hypothetical protein
LPNGGSTPSFETAYEPKCSAFQISTWSLFVGLWTMSTFSKVLCPTKPKAAKIFSFLNRVPGEKNELCSVGVRDRFDRLFDRLV